MNGIYLVGKNDGFNALYGTALLNGTTVEQRKMRERIIG